LYRTDQLTVNFAYVEATFIMRILNLRCTLIVFMSRTVFSVILCCYAYCFVQMCTVLLPAGDNPTAGNKRIYTVTSFVAPRSSPNFSTFSHKRHNFRKKVTGHKTRVSIFCTKFVQNISHSKKNSARYHHICGNVFM
jgi:hypothetical protein